MSGLSIAAGPFQPPPGERIGDALARTAAERPGGDALVVPFQNVRWSWAELLEKVDALAAGFARLGLVAGDRVGVWAPNGSEWVLTQLATARAGLILVAINPAYRTGELGHALRLSGVRALVTATRFKSSDYLAMLASLAPAAAGEVAPLFDPALPDLRWVIVLGGQTAGAHLPFDILLRPLPAPAPEAPADPHLPINIQFTSGTTGSPKGATLSHANLLHNAASASSIMGLTALDRLCIPVPLYHCFGMVLGVLACVVSGACMVLPSPSFEAEAVLDAVEAERCTALHGVPTMFIAELDHPRFAAFDLSSLRTGIMAGALCPPPLMTRVIGDMNLAEITIGYGMTETSPLTTQTRRDASFAERSESVGRPLPACEAKVVDEHGRLVPLGQPGEYCARGPGVMLGYWNQPDATAAAIRDGWMMSGDLATMDANDVVRIVGRIKDMIIRGGENIYPAEIEALLLTHPAVADAAVFGAPDAVLGERVCAWVRARDPAMGPEDLREWCKGRIAHYKIPSRVRLVDSFPMTVTGKVQKFMMRDREAADARPSGEAA